MPNANIITPQLLLKKVKRKLGLRTLPVTYTDDEIDTFRLLR